MILMTLYKREMKKSFKMLAFFCAVITLYVSVIISMYDPALMKTLDDFANAMPELTALVGMTVGATDLAGFLISYLYGFILLVFPMAFCILRGHALVAKYVEDGSMVSLLAAPVSRGAVAFTQAAVLTSGILFLALYGSALEWACASANFPGELDAATLFSLNGGLLCLHLFIGGICFFSSCFFSDARYSVAAGAGIPAFMYVLQMLANAGDGAQKAKYFTFFTLFDAKGLAAGDSGAFFGAAVLLAGAVALYAAGIAAFCGKDLHI